MSAGNGWDTGWCGYPDGRPEIDRNTVHGEKESWDMGKKKKGKSKYFVV